MPSTKLTLGVDPVLVASAKRMAAERGASVSAISSGATHLVTRDPGGVPAGSVAVATPEEYLAVLRVAHDRR